ncbi:GLPGLI family protein [Winogradskyella sp.]|uniref:GLPGLI family protein n=1 Tax=Winogradskyella sp. TaxID=1883156 RepID=UPI0025F0DC95|nr:GLPGLI family protein [Winogradskyella sp.]MBT8244407.1 GLPGLI family protein [Winogradskyella sp.]
MIYSSRIVYIFVFFLFFFFSSKSQNLIEGYTTYSVSFDYNDKNEDIDIKDLFRKTIEKLDELSYRLIFKKNLSYYSIEKQLIKDFENDIYMKSAIKIAGDAEIYTDINSDLNLLKKEFLGDRFLISDTTKQYWTVLKETKTIKGFKCFKATLKIENDLNPKGLKVTAWFTHQIPITFGPKGYHGLPGLILELSENNLKFKINNISIEKVKEPIKEPTSGISISYNDYIEYVNNKINEFNYKN